MESNETRDDRPRDERPREGEERPSRFGAGAAGERGGERPGGDRGPRGPRGPRGAGGRGGGRRKQPVFADNEIVDYKDIARLRLCIDERGKLLPRRKTYCSAGKQRELTVAVKRARHLALLQFVPPDRRR